MNEIENGVLYALELRRQHDSVHKIIPCELKADGILHRYLVNGVPYSSIYVDGQELFHNVRQEESQMIKHWNELTHEYDGEYRGQVPPTVIYFNMEKGWISTEDVNEMVHRERTGNSLVRGIKRMEDVRRKSDVAEGTSISHSNE